MFRGLYEHAIDAKGRTTFPSRFREALLQHIGEPVAATSLAAAEPASSTLESQEGAEPEERLIITTGIERCLVAYTPSAWEAFEAKLAALSQFDPAVVQLKRIYVAPATETAIDKHGRLLIPSMLREYAGLEHDVIWAGMVTTIELWAKERWTQQVEVSREDKQAIARALTGLGL